jgi:hypothetical protein
MRMVWLLALSVLVPQVALAGQNEVKDKDGTTWAVILDCSSCKSGNGSECVTGVEKGFHDKAKCGACLLESNFGTRIGYPYDLHVVGKLKDEKGEPLKNKFVKLFLPNTWTVRTRTSEDGTFRLLLGATLERKGDKPLLVDIGEHTMRSNSTAENYALFMMEPKYKPCQ